MSRRWFTSLLLVLFGLNIVMMVALQPWRILFPEGWKTDQEVASLIDQYFAGEESIRGDNLEELADQLHMADEHSEYFSQEDFQEFRTHSTQNYVGVGIRIYPKQNGLIVTEVFPGSPAELSGLSPGDFVTAVNGQLIKEMPKGEAVDSIRGPINTSVRVTAQRKGESIEFSIVRKGVHIPTVVDVDIMEPNIGYVKITEFGRYTADEFKTVLEDFLYTGVNSMILDLRDNPGGVLTGSVDLASMLLPKESLIVSTFGRDGEPLSVYQTKDEPLTTELPLVVLMNGYSASASEILAGALRDHRRATLLGETSMGKGSVQSVYSLSNGDGLKLTTAWVTLPNGMLFDKKGILPDVHVNHTLEEEQARRMRYYHQSIPHAIDRLKDKQLDEAVRYLSTEHIAQQKPKNKNI